jgi:beta-glucosidase
MNSGNRTGKEVVQMYIRDLVASRTRPIKELKGFELITLQPGESKTVRFEVTKETLEFYSANNKWEAEPGEFKIFIGGDSRTTLEASFTFE